MRTKYLLKRLHVKFQDTSNGALASKRYQRKFKKWLDELAVHSALRRGSKENSDSDYFNAFTSITTAPPKPKLSFTVITGRLLNMTGSILLGMGFNKNFDGGYYFLAFLLIIAGYAMEEK